MTWVSWLIIALSAAVISLNTVFIYRYPNSQKKWVSLFSIAAIFYTGFLYLLSVATDLVSFPDQGPVFARPAMLILLALLGAERVYDLLRHR